MHPQQPRSASLRRRFRISMLALPACASAVFLTGALQATPIPQNLGNGLDKLVESRLALKSAKAAGQKLDSAITFNGRKYATETAANYAALAASDDPDSLLVRINPSGDVDLRTLRRTLNTTFSSLNITAVDKTYRGVGVMNAYVSIDEVAALAQTPGVRSVILELKPYTRKREGVEKGDGVNAINGDVFNKLGTAFDQGVTQHRVDQINRFYNPNATLDIQGAGMSIGLISNSYGSNAVNTPAIDVANFDLPGAANNPAGNSQPVVVLQDDVGDGTVDDEGRAMCQIAYKMAPKARLAFATADGGEVGFANNIRALAGIPGFTYPAAVQQGFKGDTICDDVGYFDEPFFQDGIIAQGIDDASAFGAAYFSSAANDIGINGYDSDTRWVANGAGLTAAAGNTALAGTNINLSGVPASLYAGGFHNFNPVTGKLDVAQTVNIASNANEPPTVLQWNDPYDQNTTPNYTATLFNGSGTYVATALSFTVNAAITQGTLYEVAETATSGSTFDGIVTVYKSDGTTVIAGPQDTGTDELVRFFAPANDTGFVVKVDHFGTTTGAFTLVVRSASGFTGTAQISSSLSLLVFNLTTGAYISGSSLTGNAFATNEPIQLGATLRPTGATQVQYVIARSVVPTDPTMPTHLRYQIPGNGLSGIGPAEYFAYNTVTTGGHATAATCNGAAAYSVFRTNLPETFTSPGPAVFYFDKNSNRLATPEIRLKPTIAAADAANISTNMSYFSGDSAGDLDANPNFSGTSAASPHSAAIGALVLQAKGGSRSLTPAQLTDVLQRSTFPHDLDPNSATGSARTSNGGKVTITINSDGDTNALTGLNDPNSFSVSYIGGDSLATLKFNPEGTAATAGGVTGGNNGVSYSTTLAGGTATYFENNFPGIVFATGTKVFTFGSNSTIASTDVAATFSNLAPAPSNGTNQYWTMNLAFGTGNFTGGKILTFTVGRAVQHSAATTGTAPYTGATAASAVADLFGGGVFIPSGTVNNNGMTFSGTTTGGSTFSGKISNRIGAGYSVQDGFGFINAQSAVSQTVR